MPGTIFGASLANFDVQVGGLLGRAGDDQRRTRLVDEDVVDLVDDREEVVRRAAVLGLRTATVLDLLLERRRHVVAQVVEAELRVGAVGHVGRVGELLLLVGLHVLQDADAEPEHVVDRLHPQRVASSQVIVDGHEVDAAPRERIQDHSGGGGERLALAGLHLGDGTVMQNHAADQLHVEVAHPERPLARLAHQRERLRQQVIEALTARARSRSSSAMLPQLLIGGALHLRLISR